MCSSSLTAIHLACQDSEAGSHQLAIAGGVNVSIHPNKYLMLERGAVHLEHRALPELWRRRRRLRPGRRRGRGGAEAAVGGASATAITIYGVIRGSALNHGGKTNGYTVPNPQAQAQRDRPRAAGVGDRRAADQLHRGARHGDEAGRSDRDRGAEQGVPAAHAGAPVLPDRFGEVEHRALESAAGIAGLTKVLLQMKHRQLVPSLHSEPLEPAHRL